MSVYESGQHSRYGDCNVGWTNKQ